MVNSLSQHIENAVSRVLAGLLVLALGGVMLGAFHVSRNDAATSGPLDVVTVERTVPSPEGDYICTMFVSTQGGIALLGCIPAAIPSHPVLPKAGGSQ